MALWVDKHRPRDLSKLDYHKEQAASLKKLVSMGDFPHLLVYGPSGAGKKTRVMCLLRELYGSGVERMRQETSTFTTPSNRKLEITTLSSNYHIEVNPSDAGNQDRVVIMELVKSVAQTHQIDVNGQREFKVVILNEVDELTKDAQHALRRTMEKYISTCRIVLIAGSISRVIPAVKSRCLTIRVPAPTESEMINVMLATCKKEGVVMPTEFAERIVKVSGRSMRRALLICEVCKVQQYPFTKDQKIPELDWQIYIRDTAKLILSEQSPKKLLEVRPRLYELLVHGIPADIIMEGLVKELARNCDMSMKTQLASLAAKFEHRSRLASKDIFHLEAFVAKFMYVYKKFMEDSLGDAF